MQEQGKGGASVREATIRDAGDGDIPAITAITNHAILTTTANWNLTPVTAAQRAAWLEDRRRAGLPVLVAERAGRVIGFGSFGPFRPFEGYIHTVEHGLYVDPAAHRSGAGTALLAALVDRAASLGVHVMVGAIEAGNAASLALHERAGFVRVGLMPEVGRKFDRWLDLVLMQKTLA
jgi:phosphinothricin acetyltransferase